MGKKKYEEYMRKLNRNPIDEKQKNTKNLPVIDSNDEQISILIEEIKSDFIQGKVTKKEIPNIEKRLGQYNLTKDTVFLLAELYEKVYDNEELAMETLKKFVEKSNNLERKDFADIQTEMNRISTMMEIGEDIVAKYGEQKYAEEKLAEEKRNERKMIQELVKQLKEGDISEEQVESVIGELKQIKDRTKAIFLIGKINEVCKGPEEAKNALRYMGTY